MARRSKRMREMREKIDKDRLHDIEEALGLVKSLAGAKFSESVDVSVNLGVDPTTCWIKGIKHLASL